MVILLLIMSTGIAYSQTANQTTTGNVGYYKIPQWIKHNAEWWTAGKIGDDDFLKGMGYLINLGIIIIPPTQPTSGVPQGIPIWIKYDTKLWASGQIGSGDFVKGMQFLVANDIIHAKMKAVNQCPPDQQFDATSNNCIPAIGITNATQTLTTEKKFLLHIFSPNNPPELIAIFDKHTTSNDFVSNFRTQVLDLYPKLNHCLNTYSMDSINAAIETAKTHGNIKYIAYDNERDNANLSTPPTELVDPAVSTNEAASLVKQAGLAFSAQPTHAILMEEYTGVDWTKVDFMVMQMQQFTKDDASFISDVTKISNWIKSKNPNTIIFVQVNTAFDTMPHIISLIKSVSDKIDGVSVVMPDAVTIEPLLVGIGR